MPFAIPAKLATSTITSLYKLFHEDEFVEVEPRREALALISVMLTQVHGPDGHDAGDENGIILELLRAAITPLYSIWKSCIDNQQTLLQKDLFAIVSCTISTIGRLIPDPHCWVTEMYGIVVPMTNSALDPALRESNMHLEEDALSVWLVLMRMSRIYDEQLHYLFVRVGEVIRNYLEHLK